MTQKDPEGPKRTKKNPVRLSKLGQTSQAAFAASSYSSWFYLLKREAVLHINGLLTSSLVLFAKGIGIVMLQKVKGYNIDTI